MTNNADLLTTTIGIGGGVMGQIVVLGFMLMCVGRLLKTIPIIPNDTIPALLSLAGSIAAGLLAGWTIDNVIAGAGAALGAVGGHQFYTKTADLVTGKTAEKAAESKPDDQIRS